MNRLLITFAILAICTACGHPPKDLQQYHLDGIVVKVDTDHKMVLIKHKEIQGLMGAMTMDFPVKDDRELAKLHPGEHITARVLRSPSDYDFWIDNIRVIEDRK